MIRVAIVDDHTLVRAGLEELLETDPEIEVVGTAADGAEGIALIEREAPDVVLMDLSMPECRRGRGDAADRRLGRHGPGRRADLVRRARPRARRAGRRRGRLPAQGQRAGGAAPSDPRRRSRRVAAVAEGRQDAAHRSDRGRSRLPS